MSMVGLLSQNMAALEISTLSSLRGLVNLIYFFVVSASAIYSTSHLEVAIDCCFSERYQIAELLT
jgi:hypothetical protein